jgi:hypothetical protein
MKRFAIAALLAAPEATANVYLNGVDISSVRGQTFEKCDSVTIDAAGNVMLNCPGYQVEAVEAPKPPPRPAAAAPAQVGGALGKRYFMVTERSADGAAQYDIDVYINSKWVRRLRSDEEQIVMEVTKYMGPGSNRVLFAATKNLEGGRKSFSPASFISVIIGEGDMQGSKVMIDNPLIEWKRTGAESENVTEERQVAGR